MQRNDEEILTSVYHSLPNLLIVKFSARCLLVGTIRFQPFPSTFSL